jgi:hypothetical protein
VADLSVNRPGGFVVAIDIRDGAKNPILRLPEWWN